MKYQNFRRVVEELQVIPHEKGVHHFLFSEATTAFRKKKFNVTLDHLCLVPLVEAIGMRLKWCLEQSIDRSKDQLFNGDAVLDALQLLKILMNLMSVAHSEEWPVCMENLELLQRAHLELIEIAEKVLSAWEEYS